MTKSEFLSDVRDFWDLRDFCCDADSYYFDDIFEEGAKDDYVNEYLSSLGGRPDWRDVKDYLNDVPDGESEWYRLDDYSGFVALDCDDFSNMKNEVMEWAEDNDIFDEEPESEGEEDDDYEVEDEPISTKYLFAVCKKESSDEPSELPPLSELFESEVKKST